jgi:DNA (cytosine-5)-methyltransferase 1
MGEIAALPPNGLSHISTFSGAGGTCLGLRMAGFRTVWAGEFVEAAADTYALNAPEVYLDRRDIREVTAGDVLRAAGLRAGELDLFEGSPPCSSFSTAGSGQRGWGKEKAYSDGKVQRTDDLFFEFTRLLKGIQPRAFVAENVSGLVKGGAKGYFKLILRAMEECGYRVGARMLDAQWLGVPQARQRLIFVGTRSDLEIEPAWPNPLPYRYTVRDAIPWIDRAIHDTSGTWSSGDITDRPSPTITVGKGGANANHFQVEENGLAGTAIGREWDEIGPGEQSERYFNLVKADPGSPSPTITQTAGVRGAAGVVHPYERRKFSLEELRLICSFPADFRLTGTYRQGWERLGRSVPPLMAYRMGGGLARMLGAEPSDPFAATA